ncbi:MAG: LuxR C-terminal-related transcriptional regulator [Coriobacteriales bacterium]|nr:LuxR C-terminal-related transcriptional regulator [Coriobacteriales bacterium]
MVISPLTAKTHQKNIYAKMQVHSQQELISLIEDAIDERRAVS